MGKIRWILLTVAMLTLLLTSCGGEARFSDYRRETFNADVEYFKDDKRMWSGVIEVDSGENIEGRDMRIVLSSPAAMKGVVLYRKDGEVRTRIGEREMNGDAFRSVLKNGELIIPSGDVLNANSVKIGEKRYVRTVFSSGEEIYFDPVTEMPVEIRKDNERLLIGEMRIAEK